jgi:sugar/nucleoside kinase (ribokinase family)
VQVGLSWRDEPLQALAARLRKHGVEVSDLIESKEANYITFEDPDGNPIYVGDWDLGVDEAPEREGAAHTTTR